MAFGIGSLQLFFGLISGFLVVFLGGYRIYVFLFTVNCLDRFSIISRMSLDTVKLFLKVRYTVFY